MPTAQAQLQPGVYNSEYFSGAQVCLYIGDTLIDEVVSLSFQVSQSRSPIYGYSSMLFDDVSVGNVLVQGEMTINFKEAGYLWLILNRHGKQQGGLDYMDPQAQARQVARGLISQDVTDSLAGGSKNLAQKNMTLKQIAAQVAQQQAQAQVQANASQMGPPAPNTGNAPATAQNTDIISALQGLVWGTTIQASFNPTRRADDPKVNPFDLYITYGDITGPAGVHSTIQKLKNVYIIGTSKTITLEGVPILETYSFIAQDLI